MTGSFSHDVYMRCSARVPDCNSSRMWRQGFLALQQACKAVFVPRHVLQAEWVYMAVRTPASHSLLRSLKTTHAYLWTSPACHLGVRQQLLCPAASAETSLLCCMNACIL